MLFTCWLPSGHLEDVTLVTRIEPSSNWKLKTVWDDCIVYQERNTTEFILLKYLICGAHLILFFDIQQPHALVLNDLIDGDWFLHAGN